MNSIQKTTENAFLDFYDILYGLYESKKYLEIISRYNKFKNSPKFSLILFKYFVFVVDMTILTSISYCNIGDYNKAKEIMLFLNDEYYLYKKRYYFLTREKKNTKLSEKEKQEIKDVTNFINITLREFNQNFRFRFFNNLAYVHYKNKQYKEALSYYKKALSYDCANLQLIVGKYQSLYYANKEHRFCLKERNKLLKDIETIKEMNSSFDTYLALGKLYYFNQEIDVALNYVNIAISTLNEDNQNRISKEIYAYDWISRISYKQKNYATASIFYEKIIESLIKDENEIFIDHEGIHPKPELHRMLTYLNETKQHLADAETSNLNKSIWAGIFITTIFGLIQCHYDSRIPDINCLYIFIFVFFTGCVIVRCDIKFFKCLKEYIPSFYWFFSVIFKGINNFFKFFKKEL